VASLTFDDVVDAVVAQADVSQPTAVKYVNSRYARMVTESDFLTRVNNLGTTTAGASTLALPTDLVGLRRVSVGTVRYDLVGAEDILDIQNNVNGMSWTSPDGTTGLVAQYYDASDVPTLLFYPAFSATGTAITAIQVHEPADIAYGGAAATALPIHLRPYLIDGALAEAYEKSDERADLAQVHEQRFADGIDKLKRLKNSRVRSGPYRIVVHR
jgi:hypothetical protein